MSDNTINTLRSLFRLLKFRQMQSPSILIETEELLFLSRLSRLTLNEIDHFGTHLSTYYTEQSVQQELEDVKLTELAKQNHSTLN